MWSLMVRGLTHTSSHKTFIFCPFWTNFAPPDTKDIQWRWRKWSLCTLLWKSTGAGWHWCSSLPDRSHPGITHGKHQCCFLRWLVCAHWEVTAKQLMVKAGTGTFGFIHTTSNCMVNIGIQKALWKITIITEKRTEHTLIFYLFMCIE